MDSVAENKQPDIEDGAAVINLLRRFHYGEPAAAESTTAPAGAILPALLNPYRDSSAIRYQYPLYLEPRGDDASALGKAAQSPDSQPSITFDHRARGRRCVGPGRQLHVMTGVVDRPRQEREGRCERVAMPSSTNRSLNEKRSAIQDLEDRHEVHVIVVPSAVMPPRT